MIVATTYDSCGQWTHNICPGVFINDSYGELCNSGDYLSFCANDARFKPTSAHTNAHISAQTIDSPLIFTPSNIDDKGCSDGIDHAEFDQLECFPRQSKTSTLKSEVITRVKTSAAMLYGYCDLANMLCLNLA